MLTLHLNTLDRIQALSTICTNYKNKYGVLTDVVYGRYVVDGASQLGLVSLLGNFVTIIPTVSEGSVFRDFCKEIIDVGGIQ